MPEGACAVEIVTEAFQLIHMNLKWGYLSATSDADGEGDFGVDAHAEEVYGAKNGSKGLTVGRGEGKLIPGRGRFDVMVVGGWHQENGGVAV
jgi:hypothetical protein